MLVALLRPYLRQPKPVSVSLKKASAATNKYVAKNLFDNTQWILDESHIQGVTKADLDAAGGLYVD